MTIKDDKQILEELDRTILSLVELRKHLAEKTHQKKSVSSMQEFIEMLRREMPSFQIIVDELERYRVENNFDGVIINAGLYGAEAPPTNIWWTVVNPVDDLLVKDIDVSNLIDLVSHENRLHLLKFLTTGRKTYREISEHLQIKGGAFAHHASPLLKMKCIEKVERGAYSITERGWEVLLTILSMTTRLSEESR